MYHWIYIYFTPKRTLSADQGGLEHEASDFTLLFSPVHFQHFNLVHQTTYAYFYNVLQTYTVILNLYLAACVVAACHYGHYQYKSRCHNNSHNRKWTTKTRKKYTKKHKNWSNGNGRNRSVPAAYIMPHMHATTKESLFSWWSLLLLPLVGYCGRCKQKNYTSLAFICAERWAFIPSCTPLAHSTTWLFFVTRHLTCFGSSVIITHTFLFVKPSAFQRLYLTQYTFINTRHEGCAIWPLLSLYL